MHVQPGLSHTVTVSPDRPFTCVLAVADREPLIYVDPDAAWEALQLDELRWKAWCRDIDPRFPTARSWFAAC